ncbi:hypothetical protein [Cupriavidus basilensis]|jgi:hypothetical protein|uniref:hypothetical protein n=1 Tax=Cupriavidus basilensis TaxID=68895 RepID=UPI0039F705C7
MNKPQESEELRLLRMIDGKVDSLDKKIDHIEGRAIRLGATAGAAAGGVTGGIVAIGVFLAKFKLGV